ncbi:hypothetical protein GGR51DRAFT_570280 [Nemania sp. FL0031]|nr:hypothetical protein GGR51DRAFT_570280 [Nemania sp. FL0031]
MARTRNQTRHSSPAPEPQGSQPETIQSRQGEEQPAIKHTKHNHPRPPFITISETLSRQGLPSPVKGRSLERKQSIENELELISVPDQKRQRASRTDAAEDTSSEPAVCGGSPKQVDPLAFWAKEGRWPEEPYWLERISNLKMDVIKALVHSLAQREASSKLSRRQSNSATSTVTGNRKEREEKSAPYKNPRYPLLLELNGSYMATSKLGIADTSKDLVEALLGGEVLVPKETLFDDDIFAKTCSNLENKNEARVIQDISRLLVPSAESLAHRDKKLICLTESVNEAWDSSIPLTGTRPQPDYSVGFKMGAFTMSQLTKLSPFFKELRARGLSLYRATYYMYFPFLTCEVECGSGHLDVADRRNAHSMTLAVRAVTELYRAVKREREVHRKILGFSISHDHNSVRIFGHYPVIDIDGENIKYYRHPIRAFDFTELDGKEKWTAYRFTKSVYDKWMPAHYQMICSAIDQLPPDLVFDVAPPSSQDISELFATAEQYRKSISTGQEKAT